MRPGILDDLGLPAALEWQSNEFERRTGIHSVFKTDGLTGTYTRDVATVVFRIYQETLTNVARHANATEVDTLVAQHGRELVLTIADNGSGFDVQNVGDKKTLGLLGMRERALMINGHLDITSVPGNGTTIVLTVPLGNDIN